MCQSFITFNKPVTVSIIVQSIILCSQKLQSSNKYNSLCQKYVTVQIKKITIIKRTNNISFYSTLHTHFVQKHSTIFHIEIIKLLQQKQ